MLLVLVHPWLLLHQRWTQLRACRAKLLRRRRRGYRWRDELVLFRQSARVRGRLLARRIHDADLILLGSIVLLLARLTAAAHGGIVVGGVVVVEETEADGGPSSSKSWLSSRPSTRSHRHHRIESCVKIKFINRRARKLVPGKRRLDRIHALFLLAYEYTVQASNHYHTLDIY